MSIRKSLAAVALVAGLFSTAHAAGESLEIDGAHSTILFGIKHLNLARVWGRFNAVSGAIDYDPAAPEKGSVKLEIKAESIDTGIQKRDDHLRSPDFFNAKQFPTITFVSKSVKKTGENETAITGDLTIKGKTKEVTIPMKHTGSGNDPWGKFRRGFEGALKLNRTDFDVTFMPDGLGKEVELILSIEAVRK